MPTAPGRTVSYKRKKSLFRQIHFIVGLLIPLAFGASYLGLAMLCGAPLHVAAIIAGVLAVIALFVGESFVSERLAPKANDINTIFDWPFLRGPLARYAGTMALIPLFGLVGWVVAVVFYPEWTPWIVGGASGLATIGLGGVFPDEGGPIIWMRERGSIVRTDGEIAQKKKTLEKGKELPESSYRFWKGEWISDHILGPHTQVVGKTRSGKTVTMVLWLASVVRWCFPGSNWRCFLFDAKNELLPIVRGMNPPCPVISLCPIHADGYAWHMAADIREPAEAKTLAALLIPHDKNETQKYFPDTARLMVSKVLMFLIKHAPGEWDLQDVMLIFRDVVLLENLLRSNPDTVYIADLYFDVEKTWKSTLSTLDVTISQFETVAACWRHAKQEGRLLSLHDYLKTSSILVLPRVPSLRESVDPINRLLFRYLFQLILEGPETRYMPQGEESRTHMFLDEIGTAGEIEHFEEMMLQGAGKGVRIFLAYQSISSMWHTYGKDVANALLGQCSNTAIYNVDATTANWASGWFGEYEAMEDPQECYGNPPPKEHEVHLRRTQRKAVMPSEFQELPFPFETERITGLYRTDGLGASEVSFPFKDKLPPPPENFEILRRPPWQQALPSALTDDDIDRLQLRPFLPKQEQLAKFDRDMDKLQQRAIADGNNDDSLDFIRRMRGRAR